jgi:hypothetical protein
MRPLPPYDSAWRCRGDTSRYVMACLVVKQEIAANRSGRHGPYFLAMAKSYAQFCAACTDKAVD